MNTRLRRLEPESCYDSLLRMLEDEASIREICAMVQLMPTLALRVLEAANAETYAGSMPVDRLDRAVILLDRDGIADVATAAKQVDDFETTLDDLNAAELQRHHIVAAEAAALVAEAARLPLVEEARTAALLHDVGLQLQQESDPAGFLEAWNASQASGARLVDHERLCTNTDHCDAAKEFLEAKGLPASTVSAVEFHHDPLAAPRRVRYLAMILYTAECLVSRAGLGRTSKATSPALEMRILEELRFSPDILEAHVPALVGRIIDVSSLAPNTLVRGVVT